MKSINITKVIVVLVLALGTYFKSQAQVIFFDGLGRAVTSNQSLTGNITEGDTTSLQNTIGGYTLFDLGVNIMPSKLFNARAVVRARNEFGQFFGTGSVLEFREIQLSGIIAKGIYYEIGDIDVIQTPFTVFNFDESYNSFESSIFSERRDILQYENFNHGNKWRLQGVQSEASFAFDRGFDYLNVSAFATRTTPADNVSVPDRFLIGSQVSVVKDSLLTLGVNYTGFLDNTSLEEDFNYTNHVLTLSGEVNILKKAVGLSIIGETGFSSYDFEDLLNDTTVAFNDFFYEAGFKVTKKKFEGKLLVREVGPQFSSPSAQTQRVNGNTTPLIFPTVESGTRDRSQLLFDRFGQESLYNRAISPVLFPTQVFFNNVLPYGVATPNRAGFFLNSEIKADSNDVFRAELNVGVSQEVIGEGTDELRQFGLLSGGVAVNLSNQFGLEKDFVVSAGGKLENTTRDGRASVDLSSLLVDFGIEGEIFNKFYLQGGLKMLQASGVEFVASRDGFNGISSFGLIDIDQTERILAVGAKYKFNPRAVLSLDYNNISFENSLLEDDSYDIGQLFIYYTMSF